MPFDKICHPEIKKAIMCVYVKGTDPTQKSSDCIFCCPSIVRIMPDTVMFISTVLCVTAVFLIFQKTELVFSFGPSAVCVQTNYITQIIIY